MVNFDERLYSLYAILRNFLSLVLWLCVTLCFFLSRGEYHFFLWKFSMKIFPPSFCLAWGKKSFRAASLFYQKMFYSFQGQFSIENCILTLFFSPFPRSSVYLYEVMAREKYRPFGTSLNCNSPAVPTSQSTLNVFRTRLIMST